MPYTVLRLGPSETEVDFQLLSAVKELTLEWVKVRNLGLYNVESLSFDIGGSTVSVVDGQYSITELVSDLDTAVSAIDANYSVTFDTNTGKITVATSSGTIALSNFSNSAARVMGFTLSLIHI